MLTNQLKTTKMKTQNEIQQTKNFKKLETLQTRFLNKETLTESENALLTKAMRNGFHYTSKIKNFN